MTSMTLNPSEMTWVISFSSRRDGTTEMLQTTSLEKRGYSFCFHVMQEHGRFSDAIIQFHSNHIAEGPVVATFQLLYGLPSARFSHKRAKSERIIARQISHWAMMCDCSPCTLYMNFYLVLSVASWLDSINSLFNTSCLLYSLLYFGFCEIIKTVFLKYLFPDRQLGIHLQKGIDVITEIRDPNLE